MAMSQGKEGFNPTSPHSSSGAADSFNGTPDTRLTAFSPEDGSARSIRAPHSVHLGRGESRPVKITVASPASLDSSQARNPRHGQLQLDKDPFVSTGGLVKQPTQGLSPTASCFSPFPTTPAQKEKQTQTVTSATATPQAPEQQQQKAELPSNKASCVYVEQVLSTDIGLSRCVVVAATEGPIQVRLADVEWYLSILQKEGLCLQGSRQFRVCGEHVYARFSNIKDARVFSQTAHLGDPNWSIRHISAREFTQAIEPTAGVITAHEGQITLAVFAPSSLNGINPLRLYNFMQALLQKEGDLFAFKLQATGVEGSIFNAIVEYCENDISLQAVARLSGRVIEGFQICMTLHRPDIPTSSALSYDRVASPSQSSTTATPDLISDFQRFSISRQQSVMSPMSPMPSSYTGTPARSSHALPSNYQPLQPAYGMVPMVYHGMPVSPPYVLDHYAPRPDHRGIVPASNYSVGTSAYNQSAALMGHSYMTPRQFAYNRDPRPDGRRQNAIRIQRSQFHQNNATSQHNHVDMGRIREGIDVRTTIMLRNIPNKVDQAMLKRIIDESSWGKYDFMYLRIDFANDCNVGYAFINFVDPLDIVDFVRARGNQRWNCFKSDKVAEISYATIQGKDCLVQKFRNSSVMLEAPHYRPKLYYTMNGPVPSLAGEEEPFPGPDNHSKMKRSCENAEHVGLFTPNAGQHYRDEQRRRRSQYDRGTRLAALEEFDYDTSFSQHPPYSPQ